MEAAGVEPASEAASLGISTSVFVILISPWGPSRRGPCGQPRCNVPPWSRGASGAVIRLFDVASRFAGVPGGHARDRVPGASSGYLRSEGELVVLVGTCVVCAVTLTPSTRNPEAQLPRRDRTPPRNKVTFRWLEFYPGEGWSNPGTPRSSSR